MAIRLSRELRAAQAHRGAARLPPLSAAFVHEADAAYWAHRKIGARRDREYGGVIVKNPDGLYFATEPVPGDAMQFDLFKVLAVSPEGYYQHPRGYTCVASYHSHPSQHERIEQRNRSFDTRMVKAFLGFFSNTDFTHDVDDRAFFPAAYLSGPDGSLLRYAPSGSDAERSFALWIRAGKPARNPVGVYGPFSDLVKKVSTLGELNLVVPTALWGGSHGKVPADWVVFEPFSSTALTGMPLFTPVQDQAAKAIRLARADGPEAGVVLKAHGKEQYIATLGRPMDPRRAYMPQLFALGKHDKPLLPDGYELLGLLTPGDVPSSALPPQEAWLYQNFFAPRDLALGIHQLRTSGLLNPEIGLSIYHPCIERTLLNYRCSFGEAETALFRVDADGTVTDNGFDTALLNGTLSPQDFIRRVANAGQLSVVRSTVMWGPRGQVGSDWRPYPAFPRPGLSEAFLSADDAARYAHARVAQQRDREFGALVLKTAEQRYVVTDHLQTGANPFAFEGFYPVGPDNSMRLLPVGHQVHAWFGSHKALSMSDPAQAARLNWSADEADLNAQMFTDAEAYRVLGRTLAAYLSGAEDSLVVLEPTGSGGEALLRWKEAELAGASAIAKSLADGTLKPSGVVRELAGISGVRVVEGNRLWGPPRKLGADWQPSIAVLGYERPGQVAYGAVFGASDSAARDALARPLQNYPTSQAFFLFILKHDDRDEYVASERVPDDGRRTAFALSSLFNGAAVAPGFHCHALMHGQAWLGERLSAADQWLSRHFILPPALYDGVEQAKKLGRPGARLPVYFATEQGALLRCRLPYESTAFALQDGGSGPEDFVRSLGIGTLTALGFVNRLIHDSELAVVQTSPCWDRVGPVHSGWKPYAHLQRRHLSPVFISMDDAVRAMQARIGQTREQAYGGLVLRRDDGEFFATEPLVVPGDDFDQKWILPDEMATQGLYTPRGVVVARYHSRLYREWPFALSAQHKQVYGCMFSTRSLAPLALTASQRLSEYLLAPDGALLRLSPRRLTVDEHILTNSLKAPGRAPDDWLKSPMERNLRSGQLSPTEYVNRVATTFDVQVVVGSPLWGMPGQVRGWQPYTAPRLAPAGYVEARAEPGVGPVCLTADDAARHVHQQVVRRDSLAFGMLLKSSTAQRFVATLPVADDGSKFAHRRVFSDAGYPYGHELAGVYFCVPSIDDFHPPGPNEVFWQSYFSPVALASALSALASWQPGAQLPVYVSCADGALLRFTRSALGSAAELVRKAPRDVIALRTRSLLARDYIASLASSGTLTVVVPSATWRIAPGRPLPVALGPLFSHGEDAVLGNVRQVGLFTDKAYLSAILQGNEADSYVASLPLEDQAYPSTVVEQLFFTTRGTGSLVGTVPIFAPGFAIVAAHQVYRTALHELAYEGEALLRAHFVAWKEMAFYAYVLKHTRGLAIAHYYLTTRDGALLGYQPDNSVEEADLFGGPSRWNAVDGLHIDPRKLSHFITELTRNGRLRVLKRGPFWNRSGVLTSDLNRVMAVGDGGIRDRDEL